MGTNYYAVSSKPTVCHPIHIGKSSVGWRFLFHRVCSLENYISDEPLNTFPQWKKFLEEQTTSGKILIINEYDEVVSLDEFLNLVETKGYRFADGEFS